MKMNRLTSTLVAVAGVATGFLTATGGSGLGAEGAGDVRSRATRGTAGENGAGARGGANARDDEEEHSLAALEQRLKRKAPGPDYRAHTERLPTPELRDLLVELQALQSASAGVTPFYAFAAIRAAAQELYQREGLAAVEWADSLPRKSGQMVWRELILVAVVNDPKAAKPWVDKYQKEQEGSMAGVSNPFIKEAIRAASSQGVEALLRLKEIYGADAMGRTALAEGQLPADFDFKRLLEEFRGSHGLGEPVHLWAARDPDTAWKALTELDTGDGEVLFRYSASIFDGMSQTAGEEAATRWLVPRLDALPGEFREKAIFSLLNSHDMRYQVVDSVMAGLPRDSDRVTLAMGMVTPFAGDAPLEILQGLDSAPLRMEALLGSAKVFSRAASDPANPVSKMVNDYFTKLVGQLNLSPADRDRVLQTLGTPQDPFPGR